MKTLGLCEYLNTYFPNGQNGEIKDEKVDLATHFLEKFGVDVKNEENLYLFKYNMLSAKWTLPITHECRGIILRFSQKWQVVSRPFDKFFNMGEFYCPITVPETFNAYLNTMQLISKEDGTCIQAWFDSSKDKWRISTLGTITTTNYDNNKKETFNDLFEKTIKILPVSMMNVAYTYIFELCTFENRIVTKYKNDRVYLLAIRNVKYGDYITWQLLEEYCLQMQAMGCNVYMPDFRFVLDCGISTNEQLTEWVENKSKEVDEEIEFPEGFVVYFGGKPIAKVKNSLYKQAHDISGGNKAHAKNVIIDSIFTGNLDDIYHLLVPELQQFADNVKEKINKMILDIKFLILEMRKMQFLTQKDYAIYIIENIPVKQFHAFFFQHKEDIFGNKDTVELFNKWISKNYQRFEDIWKE